MTTEELQQMTTDLLDGREIGTTFFIQILNMQKRIREQSRPWVILRAEDGSNSVTTGNTYKTAHTLPERFMRFYGEYPIKIVDSAENVQDEFYERGYNMRRKMKDHNGIFFVDYANDNLYLSGSISKAGTMYIDFIQASADFTNGGSEEWPFPENFHPLLAFDVAITQKGGVDYDDIHARMVQYHGIDVRALENAMNMWDAQLQVEMNKRR